MTIIPFSNDNDLERLKEGALISVIEEIRDTAKRRLLVDLELVDNMFATTEANEPKKAAHPVNSWGHGHNFPGRIGVKSVSQQMIQQESEQQEIVSGMASEYSDEFGGLKNTPLDQNDEYLNGMLIDDAPLVTDVPSLDEARDKVQEAFQEGNIFHNPYIFPADTLSDDNFAVGA